MEVVWSRKVFGRVLSRNQPTSTARTTKFATVNAVAACSAFKPTMAPILRTEGEWRYASFSSTSCLFICSDCASGELSRPPPALVVDFWALAWPLGAINAAASIRQGRSLMSLDSGLLMLTFIEEVLTAPPPLER